MTGDCHVRFCESGRGKFPPATHQVMAIRSILRDRPAVVASSEVLAPARGLVVTDRGVFGVWRQGGVDVPVVGAAGGQLL